MNSLKCEVQESQDQLKQAIFDLRKTQEQNKLYQDMAQELEDKVRKVKSRSSQPFCLFVRLIILI